MVDSTVLLAATGTSTAVSVAFATSWPLADRLWLIEHLKQARASLIERVRILERSVRERRQRATPVTTLSEASEMIDVVNLGLSAGLSFDASLELYCASHDSLLAAALEEALLSWRIGAGTREEELTRVARRCRLKVLETFAIAVSEALLLGAPLTETLSAQSREIRSAHRAEVERQIERAPVKLLIPTGTLILPALLLSILGPFAVASGMW